MTRICRRFPTGPPLSVVLPSLQETARLGGIDIDVLVRVTKDGLVVLRDLSL